PTTCVIKVSSTFILRFNSVLLTLTFSIFYLQLISFQRFCSCSPANSMIPEGHRRRGIPIPDARLPSFETREKLTADIHVSPLSSEKTRRQSALGRARTSTEQDRHHANVPLGGGSCSCRTNHPLVASGPLRAVAHD